MRRPLRPFITEIKSSAAKSPRARPLGLDAAKEAAPAPAFLDTGAFLARQRPKERPTAGGDARQEAFRAADALFGAPSVAPNAPPSVAPAPMAPAPHSPSPALAEASPPPAGRVLPSLIETQAQETAAEDKPRRAREKKPAVKPAAPRRRAASVAPTPAEDDLAEPETAQEDAPFRRERPSIRARWVLKTALKAGEKWKARQCKAAR